MSVEVKTPNKAQFEHAEFPCGDVKSSRGAKPKRPSLGKQESCPQVPGRINRKRRYSERAATDNNNRSQHGNNRFKGRAADHRGRRDKIVLPTKFLLGGNINDPLNLNSLCDEEINQALNQVTPVSSPIPLPLHRKQVQVIIPTNITDPLNLNSGEDVDLNLISPKQKKKRKHNRYNKKKSLEPVTDEDGKAAPVSAALTIEQTPELQDDNNVGSVSDKIPQVEVLKTEAQSDPCSATADKVRKIMDKIVSPVIPQISPKSRKRKRTSSGGESSAGVSRSNSKDEEPASKCEKLNPTSPVKYKGKKPGFSNQTTTKQKGNKKKKFVHGNYNRYYGYRNPGEEEDHRLKCFHRDWFEGKDILDIGCNVGDVTLQIAKEWWPRKIVGIDVDGSLIRTARQNVRHFMADGGCQPGRKYPVSMHASYGPISAPAVAKSGGNPGFPNNVAFVQANYVLDRDELVDLQQEEYDVILGLSVTKWMHLHAGDAGMKRTFRRMFRQLRPGGKLILEPQSWASYKKKKKLTEDIHKAFKAIRFKPEQFTEYLLSKDVGFSKCEMLETPFNKSKGFQRPLQIYTKSDTAFPTPFHEAASSCPTPSMKDSDSRGATPRFQVGSGPATPSKDSYCSGCNTPRSDSGAATPGRGVPDTSTRPLESLRINSAPGLLETVAFSAEALQCELEAVRRKSQELEALGIQSSSGDSVPSPQNISQTKEVAHPTTQVESADQAVPTAPQLCVVGSKDQPLPSDDHSTGKRSASSQEDSLSAISSADLVTNAHLQSKPDEDQSTAASDHCTHSGSESRHKEESSSEVVTETSSAETATSIDTSALSSTQQSPAPH